MSRRRYTEHGTSASSSRVGAGGAHVAVIAGSGARPGVGRRELRKSRSRAGC